MRVGGMLGRLARRVVDSARPEAERAAAKARAAAQAARPHIERAAAQAADFAKAHDEEIRRVAEAGAHIAADRMVPPLLRPVVNAAREELRRDAESRDAEARDAAAPAADGHAPREAASDTAKG